MHVSAIEKEGEKGRDMGERKTDRWIGRLRERERGLAVAVFCSPLDLP